MTGHSAHGNVHSENSAPNLGFSKSPENNHAARDRRLRYRAHYAGVFGLSLTPKKKGTDMLTCQRHRYEAIQVMEVMKPRTTTCSSFNFGHHRTWASTWVKNFAWLRVEDEDWTCETGDFRLIWPLSSKRVQNPTKPDFGYRKSLRATGNAGSTSHRRVVGALQAVVVNCLKN